VMKRRQRRRERRLCSLNAVHSKNKEEQVPIIRGERPKTGWYALDRRIAEDSRLSWSARGLLIYLLVKPDHWQVSVAGLAKATRSSAKPTGRDGIYAILKELELAGYIDRQQSRRKDGTLGTIDYVVSETPLPDQPHTADPFTANPTQDKTNKIDKTKGKQGPPEWLPSDAWAEYRKMREAIGSPLSAAAQKRALHTLSRLRDDGHDPEAVLKQSAAKGWRGLFPVKGSGNDAALQAYIAMVGDDG